MSTRSSNRFSRTLVMASVTALIAMSAVAAKKLAAGSVNGSVSSSRSVARAAKDSLPVGWFAAGDHPEEYVMALDPTAMRAGRPSAKLESRTSQAHGFGTLMQQISPDAYRGHRVRFSGDVRTRDVTGSASLWLRVDGANNESIAFDNAQNRALHGTSDWQHFELVLDVPGKAEGIAFGLLLAGAGTAWVSGLKFEEVPTTVAVTDMMTKSKSQRPMAPVNLDFATGSR